MIAISQATKKRPTCWIVADFYKDWPELDIAPVKQSMTAKVLGYIIVDSIEHFTRVLIMLNKSVRQLQIETFKEREKVHEADSDRQQNVRGKLEVHATQVAQKWKETIFSTSLSIDSSLVAVNDVDDETKSPFRSNSISLITIDEIPDTKEDPKDKDRVFYAESKSSPLLKGDSLPRMVAADPVEVTIPNSDVIDINNGCKELNRRSKSDGKNEGKNEVNSKSMKGLDIRDKSLLPDTTVGDDSDTENSAKGFVRMGAKLVRKGVLGIANEGFVTVSTAVKGTLRSVLEGIRAVELLTVGELYDLYGCYLLIYLLITNTIYYWSSTCCMY